MDSKTEYGTLRVGDVVRSVKGDFRVTRLAGDVVYGNPRKKGEWSEAVHEVRGYWVQVERRA